jgi:hypothetical protein
MDRSQGSASPHPTRHGSRFRRRGVLRSWASAMRRTGDASKGRPPIGGLIGRPRRVHPQQTDIATLALPLSPPIIGWRSPPLPASQHAYAPGRKSRDGGAPRPTLSYPPTGPGVVWHGGLLQAGSFGSQSTIACSDPVIGSGAQLRGALLYHRWRLEKSLGPQGICSNLPESRHAPRDEAPASMGGWHGVL